MKELGRSIQHNICSTRLLKEYKHTHTHTHTHTQSANQTEKIKSAKPTSMKWRRNTKQYNATKRRRTARNTRGTTRNTSKTEQNQQMRTDQNKNLTKSKNTYN